MPEKEKQSASFNGFIEEITENPVSTAVSFIVIVLMFLIIFFGLPTFADLISF